MDRDEPGFRGRYTSPIPGYRAPGYRAAVYGELVRGGERGPSPETVTRLNDELHEQAPDAYARRVRLAQIGAQERLSSRTRTTGDFDAADDLPSEP